MYDHHQIGGNGSRENGTPYASAGLYWKYNGREIIEKLSIQNFNSMLSTETIDSVFYSLDTMIFQEIDKIDNGIPARETAFDYIPSFLPSWRTSDNFKSAYEDSFKAVLEVTISILTQIILSRIDRISSFNYVLELYRKDPNRKIMELPGQSFPWLTPVVLMNQEFNGQIDFVIFKYPSGGWAAQCVPPSQEERFNQRVPFPESWAGQTKELPRISGVTSATFCHNGRFFARADSKDDIIKMCNIAIESV